MNLERPGMEVLYEKSLAGIGNFIQFQLAEKHGEDLGVFIDEHAGDFRKLIEERPELLKNFEKDPEATLAEIEGIIYH